MTVYLRKSFADYADGTTIGSAIPDLIGLPSSLTTQTISAGKFTLTGYNGTILKDIGALPRNLRFVTGFPSQVITAAVDRGDGTTLAHVLTMAAAHSSAGELIGVTVFVDYLTFANDTGLVTDYFYPDGPGFGRGFSAGNIMPLTSTSIILVDVTTDDAGVYSVAINGMRVIFNAQDNTTPGQLPPPLVGSGLIGLVISDPANSYYSIRATDGVDVTSISAVAAQRPAGDASHKELVVSAATNKADVTNFAVSVKVSATGEEIATGSAARGGSVTRIETGGLTSVYTGIPLTVHLTTNLGDPDQEDDFFLVGPFIPMLLPYEIGCNVNGFTYYGPGSGTRDLAHYMRTSLSNYKHVQMPWMPDGHLSDSVPGSDVGMQYNGRPTSFSAAYPDNAIVFQLPNFLEPEAFGDYQIDRSAQPGWHPYAGVQPGQDPSHLTVTRNYYGENQDRLHFAEHDHSAHVFVDDDNRSLTIYPASHPAAIGQPGGYLEPSTFAEIGDEEYTITIRKVGDASERFYTDTYLNWWRRLGGIDPRFMTDEGVNEVNVSELPFGFLTPEMSNRTDGNWAQEGSVKRPLEYQLQLAKEARGSLWHTIPRYASVAYARSLVATAKAVAPDLPVVYFEAGNENWNFQFPQSTYFGLEGWRRGLHKADAVPGQNEGLAIPEAFTPVVPLDSYAEGERRQYQGVIYQRVGTQDTSKMPAEAGSGWETEGNFQTAQVRMIAETAHGWIDGMADEAGDLWGVKYKFLIGSWQSNPSFIEGGLQWPNAAGVKLGARVHGICTGMYFGGEQHQLYHPYQSSTISAATPGPARVTAFIEALEVEKEKQIAQWSATQSYLAGLNVANGWSLFLACYETAIESQILVFGEGYSREVIDGWFTDVMAAYRDSRIGDLWADFLIRVNQEAGGPIYIFQQFAFPWHDHLFYDFILYWHLSRDPTDLTNPLYLAVIQVMKTLGIYFDPELDPATATRRRRAPQQLRRLAA